MGRALFSGVVAPCNQQSTAPKAPVFWHVVVVICPVRTVLRPVFLFFIHDVGEGFIDEFGIIGLPFSR